MRQAVFICLLTISALLVFAPLHAAPALNWSYRYGGASVNMGYDVAVDGSGNVIITGTFAGTMNFGGGPLTSAGSWDIFLAKFDPSGAHLWSQRFGAGGNDAGNAVAVDGAGNIAIAGYFRGPLSFGGATLTGQGGNDIFAARFNANGVHQWSRGYGSVRDDEGQDVAMDASGNVILTGSYAGAINFGAGAAPLFGSRDCFVLKLDAAGAYQWINYAGGFNNDVGNSVAVDSFNRIFVTGLFNNTVSFGGAPLVSAGSSDAFIVKYAADGSHLWSTRIGGANSDSGQGIAVDASGSALVTGMYNDAFLAKYDADGVQQWTQSFDGSDILQSMDLAVSASGTIAITGNFRGTANFGGGQLASAGDYDIFIAFYEASGAHRWSQRFGATAGDWGYGGSFDPSGNLVATGLFFGSVDFGGGTLVSAGLSDVYLVKFDDEAAPVLDTTPPVIACPGNIEVQATVPGGTPATNPAVMAFLAGVSATDDTDPAPVITNNAPALFPYGPTVVTFHAQDASGNAAECSATVTVLDTTAPTIAVHLNHTVLWPPNHKMVTVCADLTLSDNSGVTPTFSLVSITSDEAADGTGDGHSPSDIHGAAYGTPDECFDLRAERAGTGDGRVYEIVYSAQDGSGNTAYATVYVRVPHDMSAGEVPGGPANLTSIHPNPFNPQTTLEYSLTSGDRVRIAIYDARGTLVRRLVDEVVPAGAYTATWNGTDDSGHLVGSGIYFVKLVAGKRADTRKIVMLK